MRDNIITSLQSILETSTGLITVHDWKVDKYKRRDLPAINLKDISDNFQEDYAGIIDHNLQIEIILSSTNSTDHRLYIQKIYKSLGDNPSLNGYVDSIDYNGDETDIDQEEHIIIETVISITCRYTTKDNDFSIKI
jgi:hypothetical protein